jgi:hypothetical protein
MCHCNIDGTYFLLSYNQILALKQIEYCRWEHFFGNNNGMDVFNTYIFCL